MSNITTTTTTTTTTATAWRLRNNNNSNKKSKWWLFKILLVILAIEKVDTRILYTLKQTNQQQQQQQQQREQSIQLFDTQQRQEIATSPDRYLQRLFTRDDDKNNQDNVFEHIPIVDTEDDFLELCQDNLLSESVLEDGLISNLEFADLLLATCDVLDDEDIPAFACPAPTFSSVAINLQLLFTWLICPNDTGSMALLLQCLASLVSTGEPFGYMYSDADPLDAEQNILGLCCALLPYIEDARLVPLADASICPPFGPGVPYSFPSAMPSQEPTKSPTSAPSTPSARPSSAPTSKPTLIPSANPTMKPTLAPSISPSQLPSMKPTISPSASPITPEPSTAPTPNNDITPQNTPGPTEDTNPTTSVVDPAGAGGGGGGLSTGATIGIAVGGALLIIVAAAVATRRQPEGG